MSPKPLNARKHAVALPFLALGLFASDVEAKPPLAQRPQVVVVPPAEWQGTVWIPPPAVAVVPGVAPVVVTPAAPVVVAPAQPTVIVTPPRPAVIVTPAPVIHFGGWKGKGKGWKGKGKGWKHW